MKQIIWMLLLSVALFSCSKNLEEHPQSIAAEVFYKSPAEIEAGLNAIYEPIRNTSTMGAFYAVQLEIYTEYMYGRGSHAPLNAYTGLDNTNITRVGDMWSGFYRAIRNANIVIQRTPLAAEVSEEAKLRYLAEAKFMRALWYFQLVRNWAGVPIRTEANMDSINLKRSTAQEVYDFIVSDLTAAKTDLPDNPRLVGAPSKWTAKTLLTHVFMNMERYTEARDEAAEVIASGKYNLVPVSVADDFEKIFGTEANNTPEEIFYIKYSSKVPGLGNGYPMYAHYPKSGYYPPGGFYTLYSDAETNAFVKNWDKNDLRYTYNWYGQTFGLGATTILGKKFSDKTSITDNGAGNDFPMYRYADLLLFYAEIEARVNAGATADALEKLNMVHRRGYGKPADLADPDLDFELSDFPDLTAFINGIVKERAYENIAEGKHWLDLKRLGLAKQTILEMKGITVADKHLLWPIPTNEYNYNKAINPATDQNPGY